jgi:hypothetical protein
MLKVIASFVVLASLYPVLVLLFFAIVHFHTRCTHLTADSVTQEPETAAPSSARKLHVLCVTFYDDASPMLDSALRLAHGARSRTAAKAHAHTELTHTLHLLASAVRTVQAVTRTYVTYSCCCYCCSFSLKLLLHQQVMPQLHQHPV